MGEDFGCVIEADAQVLCWGSNSRGQLGVGRVPADLPESTFAALPVGIAASSITARGRHACALQNGQVLCWGEGNFGQTGDPQRRNAIEPMLIPGLTGTVQVATAGTFACALDDDGAVWCWGANGARQFGTQAPAWSAEPVRVSGIPSAVDLAVGGRTACVVTRGATVVCWGDDRPPAPVNTIGAEQVAVSANAVCALVLGGRVTCWGQGLAGQLGHGSFGNSTFPVGVLGLWDATAIEAGSTAFCVQVTGGALGLRPGTRCWGTGAGGQLGVGDTGVSTMVQVVEDGMFVSGGADGCWRSPAGVVQCRGTTYGPGWVRIGGIGGAAPAQPPAAPAAVTATGITQSDAMLTWEPPVTDGAQVTGYAVVVTRSGTPTRMRTTEPTIRLGDLEPGQSVSVSVSAQSAVGPGTRASVSFRTDLPPPAVRLTARTPTTIRLAWTVEGPAAVRWRGPGGTWRISSAVPTESGAVTGIPVGSRATPVEVEVRVNGYAAAIWRGATEGIISPRVRIIDAEGRAVSSARLTILGHRVIASAGGVVDIPRITPGWHRVEVSATTSDRIRVSGSRTVVLGPGRAVLRLPASPPLRTTSVALERGGQPLTATLTTAEQSVVRDGFTFAVLPERAGAPERLATDDAGRAVFRWFDAPTGPRRGQPKILYVGDSHLYPMIPALQRMATEQGAASSFIWQFGCPWIGVTVLGVAPGGAGRPCREIFVNPLLSKIEQERPTLVVLVSRSIVKQDIMEDGVTLVPGTAAWLDVVEVRTAEMVQQLVDRGLDVVIVEPLPEVVVDGNACLRTQQWRDCVGALNYPHGSDEWRSIVRGLARVPEVTTVSLATVFCREAACPAAVNGIPVRRDDNHPTPEFTLHRIPEILERLESAGVDVGGGRVTTPALTVASGDSRWTIDLVPGPLAIDVADLLTNRRTNASADS